MRHIRTEVYMLLVPTFRHCHSSQHGSIACTTTLEGGCWEGPTRFHAGLRGVP